MGPLKGYRVLELAGIGPGRVLKQAGVECIFTLPGGHRACFERHAREQDGPELSRQTIDRTRSEIEGRH